MKMISLMYLKPTGKTGAGVVKRKFQGDSEDTAKKQIEY